MDQTLSQILAYLYQVQLERDQLAQRVSQLEATLKEKSGSDQGYTVA